MPMGSIRVCDQKRTSCVPLVSIGVYERSQKQLLAIEYGILESTQSWRNILLKLKHRGTNLALLTIGNDVIGF